MDIVKMDLLMTSFACAVTGSLRGHEEKKHTKYRWVSGTVRRMQTEVHPDLVH